jgi:hypothetical protein
LGVKLLLPDSLECRDLVCLQRERENHSGYLVGFFFLSGNFFRGCDGEAARSLMCCAILRSLTCAVLRKLGDVQRLDAGGREAHEHYRPVLEHMLLTNNQVSCAESRQSASYLMDGQGRLLSPLGVRQRRPLMAVANDFGVILPAYELVQKFTGNEISRDLIAAVAVHLGKVEHHVSPR